MKVSVINPGDSFDYPPFGISGDLFHLPRLREAWMSVLQDERPGGCFEDFELGLFEHLGKTQKIVDRPSFSPGSNSDKI